MSGVVRSSGNRGNDALTRVFASRRPSCEGPALVTHIACVRSRARKAFFGCQIWPPSIPPFSRGEGRWNRRGVTGSGSLSLGLYGSFARIVWIRRTWFDGEIACPFTYLRDVSGHFTTRSICLAFNCRETTQLGSKPKLRYGSSNPKSELAAQESWEQVCSEAICLLRVPQGSSKLNPSDCGSHELSPSHAAILL